MNPDELKAVFDQQAANYDKQWTRMAPVNNGLYFLLESVFSNVPEQARVLCVGVGTGKELIYLARKYPQWHFTAVEPSGPMLDICRQQAVEQGVESRCIFHEGYLDSLPETAGYDVATCFLVSQFILDKDERTNFFRKIHGRLKRGGILANSDLASDTDDIGFDTILGVWLRVMSGAAVTPESLAKAKAAYAKDVAILPPSRVASFISAAGFEKPVQFFQAGLIHAWFARSL